MRSLNGKGIKPMQNDRKARIPNIRLRMDWELSGELMVS
jgi:hypothetical protein